MLRSVIVEAIYFTVIFHFSLATGLQKCNPEDLISLDSCPEHASCSESTKTCECVKGYILKHSKCVIDEKHKAEPHNSPNTSSLVDIDSSGHVVAAVLVPLFVISIISLAIYFGRKYRMFSWMRNKFNQQNTNYDEFMIGQDADDDDDPPLR